MVLLILLIVLLIICGGFFFWIFIEERAQQKRFADNIQIMFEIGRMNEDELFKSIDKHVEELNRKNEYEKQHPVLAKIKEWREYYYL